jgi:two-component system, OmpR family, phosphate regulon sensor histidine kinase PhoR
MAFKRKTFPRRIFYRVAAAQFLIILGCLVGAGLLARSLFRSQIQSQLRTSATENIAGLQRSLENKHPLTRCPEIPRSQLTHWAVIQPDGQVRCTPSVEFGFSDALKIVNWGDVLSAPSRVHFYRNGNWAIAVYVPASAEWLGAVGISTIESDRWSATVDMALLIAFLLMAMAALLFSVYMARRLVFPLGRLLVKTKNIHLPDVVSEDDLKEQGFDEWLELESNIDDMRRDLLAKTKRLSREKLELDTIMGAISDAILAVDPEGNPLFYNSRFELLFGKEGEKLESSKLWGIFRDPEILTAFRRALKEGRVESTRAIALQQTLPKRYFSLSASPLRRQDASVYGAVGIFHDVTELKAAEQMRIDFVANVSHELRTPLTVIKGYADTLIQDNQGKLELLDFLNAIARNSDRLMLLMNDLLDLSSIESDSIIQRETLSTEEVTQRLLNQLKGAFDRKDQIVEVQVDSKDVFADPHRLEQVLVNLLGNANKYTPEKGKITVNWYRDGANTVLKVTDTGPGIPLEHHQRLFERFYRVDKARSRDQGGTGLGLAIVKHIVQRHEGSVWLESAPGKGTSFFCRFPDESNLFNAED